MKLVIFVLFFMIIIPLFSESAEDVVGEECEQISIDVPPPYYVSSGYKQGDKTYENFRSLDDYKKKNKFLPRRSIVKVLDNADDYVDQPDYYVPIEVVKLPTDGMDDELKKSKKMRKFSTLVANKQNMQAAENGSTGFVYNKALKKLDDHTFVLNEDSTMLAIPELKGLGIKALKLAKDENGEFKVNRCCQVNGKEDEAESCHDFYIFDLFTSSMTKIKNMSIDMKNLEHYAKVCSGGMSYWDELTAFPSKDVESLMKISELAGDNSGDQLDGGISQLKIMDERGMVRLPIDKSSWKGPFGSYHYKADDESSVDLMGKSYTVCALTQVLKEHRKRCTEPGCELQVGDMFHMKSWRVHKTHENGECVDFRPLRKTDERSSLTVWSQDYDRKKNVNFIKLLKEAGGSNIYFNDPQIYNKDRAVTKVAGHSNHIHVCFKNTKKVQQTCKEGVK